MKVDHIFDRGSGKTNEDVVLIEEHFFGVFDGASSLTGYLSPKEKTGGYLASHIAKSVFQEGGDSLVNLAKRANFEINQEMKKENVDISDKANRWCTALAVIKLEEKFFEWVQIGDSLILIIFDDGSFRTIVKEYDQDKKMMILWKKLADKKVENIRAEIDTPLFGLRRRMNVDYGNLNGEKEMVKFLNHGREKLERVKHLLLFTDGLFLPKSDPRKNDNWQRFVDLYLTGGLKALKTFVRQLEQNDPRCWKYPRYKVHDDIAAISLSL